MKTFPNIDRPAWLALWAQGRRRRRARAAQVELLPAPVLGAEYPGVLVWEWDLPDPYRWNVWLSWDDGGSWNQVEDYWATGSDRSFVPAGGSELYFIVGVDELGNELTEHSNIIRPDDVVPYIDYQDGIVAHWAFEEADGMRTAVAAWTPFQLEPVNGGVGSSGGMQGNGVAFDGLGGYLAGTEDTDMFMPTAAGFTVSVWANFSTVTDPWAAAYVASLWDDTNWPAGSIWHLFVVPGDNSVAAEVVGQVSGFTGLYGWAPVTGWVHLCLVYEPATNLWRLYGNGVMLAEAACDYQLQVGRLGVGAHTNPITSPPDFLVDELTVWGRALSATEISVLYNDGNGRSYTEF